MQVFELLKMLSSPWSAVALSTLGAIWFSRAPISFAPASASERRFLAALWILGVLPLAFASFEHARGIHEGSFESSATISGAIPFAPFVHFFVLSLACAVAIFAHRYLEAEPGRKPWMGQLFGALAAILCFVNSNHLLLMAGAWSVASFFVRKMIVFYPERAVAVRAARFKLWIGLSSDCLFLAATMALVFDGKSLWLDELCRQASGRPLSLAEQTAAALFATSVVMRSAQMPFHGWIIKVMEAPTPVSAFLHAGAVNLGAIFLFKISSWFEQAVFARALLFAFGATSLVLAVVESSRSLRIKERLAFSTVGQMGFMLLECAAGAWHLALLHWAAHSIYKAFAFLNSGSVVEAWRDSSHLRPASPVRLSFRIPFALAASSLTLLLAHNEWLDLREAPFALLLLLSMVPLAENAMATARAERTKTIVLASASAVAWTLLYRGVTSVARTAFSTHSMHLKADAHFALAIGFAFLALYSVDSALKSAKEPRVLSLDFAPDAGSKRVRSDESHGAFAGTQSSELTRFEVQAS